MNAILRLMAGFIAWLRGWTRVLTRSSGALEDADAIVERIDAYREAAADLNVAKSELRARPEETRSIQAALCLEVATVVRALADALALFVTGSFAAARRDSAAAIHFHGDVGAPTMRRRAASASELYHEVLRLVEQARIEMADTGEPRPLDPDELIGEGVLAEPPVNLQVMAQKLEETFEIELALAEPKRGALPQLLARLRSTSSIAGELASNHGRGATDAPGGDRLWVADHYRRIFRLWVLVSEELVCPGITAGIADSGEADPRDVFLMTDPVARARYEREGRLEELERDIRYEVMRGRPWEPEDLEYLGEVSRLQSVGTLRRTASFWNMSPHPPVFKAVGNGRMSIGGRQYRLRRGQEVVWACPMLRDAAGTDGPALIGRFTFDRIGRLCGGMSNAMLGRGSARGSV